MNPKKDLKIRKSAPSFTPGPTVEVISRLAELMREREGFPENRDIEFWLRAESELKGTDQRRSNGTKP